MALANSGTNYIDALLHGYDWGGALGVGQTLHYAFSTGHTAPTSGLKTAITAAFQQWSNVANLTFGQVNNGDASTDIQVSYDDLDNLSPTYAGVTYPSGFGNFLLNADITYDTDLIKSANAKPGNATFMVLMHEIGHALGLDHPRDYQNLGGKIFQLSESDDTTHATVMSYYSSPGVHNFSSSPSPFGPMIYDIAAIQYLYGANTTYHAGDDNYLLSSTTTSQMYTLWDAGGNDTLDASKLAGAILDLREGLSYYTAYNSTSIWNAFGSNIENVKGSSGVDHIYGNDIANQLVGNSGNDIIRGYDNDDRIYGDGIDRKGSGIDQLLGDDGNDSIYGGGGIDNISGGDGEDLLYGDAGNDSISGENGGDTLYGGAGNDSILGNGGDNLLYGEIGNDSITTDSGDNEIYGGAGKDTIIAGSGDDTMYGDGAGDTVKGTDELHGGDGDDGIYGGGGNDKVYGDGGDDLIYGDDTADTLYGTDTLYGGAGNDIIYGGGNGDKIYGEDGDDLIFAAPAVFNVKDKADTIVGGAGNDTMDGGGGADQFYFYTGSGADEIADFEGEGVKGGDVLRLIGYGLNKTTVLSHVSYVGSDATIDLGGGNVILVHGVVIPFITTDFLFS